MKYDFSTISVDFLERNEANDKIKKYTYGDMFFKPFEDKVQFSDHARQVASGSINLLLSVFLPFVMLGVVAVYLAFSLAAYSFALINDKVGGDQSQSLIGYKLASATVYVLLQSIVDVLVLPISVLTLLTRGVSTGLKSAGLYSYDADLVNQGSSDDADNDNDDLLSDTNDATYGAPAV